MSAFTFNGVAPDHETLESVVGDAAVCADANRRHYNIYRLVGVVLKDGRFVPVEPWPLQHQRSDSEKGK